MVMVCALAISMVLKALVLATLSHQWYYNQQWYKSLEDNDISQWKTMV